MWCSLMQFTLLILYYSAQALTQSTSISPPSQVPDELPALGLAAVVNQDNASLHWQVEVVIGKQKFNLSVDTGSSDLWVYGPKLYKPLGINPVAHNTYTCVQSSANNCTVQGNFSVSYESGAALGLLYYDAVEIAGATIPSMGIGAAEIVEYQAQYKPDGFLGLGFMSHNHAYPKQLTFMEQLMRRTRMHVTVFTVNFKPPPNVPELEFGVINYNKAKGPLSKAPIDPAKGRWQVNNISFTVGHSGQTPIYATYGAYGGQTLYASMLFDTGGGYGVVVPWEVAASYYAQIPGSYNATNQTAGTISWNFPCNATVPDLILNAGNGTIVYNASVLNPGYDPTSTNGGCSGQLMASSLNESDVGNLGAAFFSKYFVVFNQEEPSIMWG